MYYILDELTVAPGGLTGIRARVEREYVPGAVARGLTLERTLVSTVELHDEPNQLLFLWSFPDVATYWASRSAANRYPRSRRSGATSTATWSRGPAASSTGRCRDPAHRVRRVRGGHADAWA